MCTLHGAVREAARTGDLEKVRALIAEGADPNAKDNIGWVPLHVVAIGDGQSLVCHSPIYAELARLLLDRGADPNAKIHSPGHPSHDETPLHFAALFATTEVARLLLDRGADPNAKDEVCETPLHNAAHGDNGRYIPGHDHAEVARLLLDRGADPNARSKYHQTPLQRAEHAKIVDLLREHGAKDSVSERVLHDT